MSFIMQRVSDFLDTLERNGDPRVKEWFMMSSPIPALTLGFAYWYFVLHLGPRMMANRKPYNLKPLIVVYNIVQIVLNAYVVEEAFRLLWLKNDYSITCMLVDYSDTPLGRARARTVWLVYIIKMLDLLDTVFFVLRKKDQQVTFLHVYHHSLVFLGAWMITKYFAGGHIALFGTLNAFVHCVMYSYYLYAALNPGQYVWWKKYLTQLQLIQFVICGVHGVLALLDSECSFPKALIAFGLPQDLLMIVLFLNFYRKAYEKRKKEKADNDLKLSQKNQEINGKQVPNENGKLSNGHISNGFVQNGNVKKIA